MSALIKNPNELPVAANFAGMIYGQPGVGKSTLCLSAPDPVHIDADKGVHRVEKRFQAPTLPMNRYDDLLSLLNSGELDPFKTIVIDTFGRLVEMIGDYVGRQNPKNLKGDGSLALAGYGAVKTEFQRLLRLLKEKNKHILFVAHEREEKDGDTKIVRPDVSGSSGKDLLKDLDFMGYMEMKGSKVTISFTPQEKFYAKNSLNLPSVIDVPKPESVEENNFIQKVIIEQSHKRMQADADQNAEYDRLIANVRPVIDAVSDAKTADEALATVLAAPVIWDSQRSLKYKLNEKVKAIGLAYDRETKAFKKAEAPKSNAPAAETQPQQSPEAKPSEGEAAQPKAAEAVKQHKKATTKAAAKKTAAPDADKAA